MQFVCPNCKCISEANVQVRQDKPMEMPKITPVEDGPRLYWTLAGYEINLLVWRLDHWNRSIQCGICKSYHTYYEE